MSDNVELELAKKKFSKADKIARIGLTVFLVFVLAIVTFTSTQVYIVQNTIAENQKINNQAAEDRFQRRTVEAARQSQITQQYIKCVASTLIIPIPDRDPNGFDNCSRTAQGQNLEGEDSTTPKL